MREFDVCGLGNAIVDIFVEVTDDEFAALGFERGTMRLVDIAEQHGKLITTEAGVAEAPKKDSHAGHDHGGMGGMGGMGM